MTTNGAAAPARFEMGRVIGRMFQVVGDNLVTFIALAVLLSIPNLIFTFYAVFARSIGIHLVPTLVATGYGYAWVGDRLGEYLVFLVFDNLQQAAITQGTIISLNGGRASLGDCLLTGLRHALPLSIIAVMASIGIILGFILIVVPGVILMLIWSMLIPVRVAERTPILETFSRSAELTRGYKGQIFGLIAIYYVLAMGLNFVIRPLTGLSVVGPIDESVSMVFVALFSALYAMGGLISAAGVASIYFELRTVKEGVGPEQLAAIFA